MAKKKKGGKKKKSHTPDQTPVDVTKTDKAPANMTSPDMAASVGDTAAESEGTQPDTGTKPVEASPPVEARSEDPVATDDDKGKEENVVEVSDVTSADPANMADVPPELEKAVEPYTTPAESPPPDPVEFLNGSTVEASPEKWTVDDGPNSEETAVAPAATETPPDDTEEASAGTVGESKAAKAIDTSIDDMQVDDTVEDTVEREKDDIEKARETIADKEEATAASAVEESIQEAPNDIAEEAIAEKSAVALSNDTNSAPPDEEVPEALLDAVEEKEKAEGKDPANEITSKPVDTAVQPEAVPEKRNSISEGQSATEAPMAESTDTRKAESAPDGPGQFFSLEELKRGLEGIDWSRRELYLSPSDFEKVFNMTKEDFSKLKLWKRQSAKKRVGLF